MVLAIAASLVLAQGAPQIEGAAPKVSEASSPLTPVSTAHADELRAELTTLKGQVRPPFVATLAFDGASLVTSALAYLVWTASGPTYRSVAIGLFALAFTEIGVGFVFLGVGVSTRDRILRRIHEIEGLLAAEPISTQ